MITHVPVDPGVGDAGRATAAEATARARPTVRDRARYLVIGAVIGALWIAHRDEPLWEHAVRTLVVLVAVPLLAAPVLAWWRARRRDATVPSEQLSLPRFVAAKAMLVAVALGLDVLLSSWWPGLADLLVAAGLVLAIAVLGPLHHHRLLVPSGRDRTGRR